jgi:hypothetical protein
MPPGSEPDSTSALCSLENILTSMYRSAILEIRHTLYWIQISIYFLSVMDCSQD